MNYNSNPQRYLNGFFSACRNVFLVSSIAIALYGYSNSFNIKSSIDFTRLSSTMLFMFCFVYGINTAYSMYEYLSNLEKDKERPEDINLNIWRVYMYLLIVYIIFLFFITIFAVRRFINNKS